MITSVPSDYAVLDTAKWFAIVHNGGIAFRFGPFDGPTVGQIMKRCVEEKIPLLVTADCGDQFDWSIARAMRGEKKNDNDQP